MTLFALLLAGLAVEAPAQAQPDPWMDSALAYARERLGQPEHSGWQAVEARAEGSTLVIVAAPPPEGTNGLPVGDLAVSVAIGMCQSPSRGGFFADGRRLRVQLRGRESAASSATVSACPDRAEATRIMAGNIQRKTGQHFGQLILAGARAEGTELVILIDGPTGWRNGYSAERINAIIFPGYCRNPDTNLYFDGTRSVRIDTLENSRDTRRGLPINSCTPYSGG
jgi:hypothetical protein